MRNKDQRKSKRKAGNDLVIVGGSGFIGAAIARGCSRGGESCVPLGSAECDLTDPMACAEALPDLCNGRTVVYAAGIPRARSDTLEALQTNVAMVHNLLAAMREARPSRMVFLSSVEVYGIPRELPVDEQTEIRPRTLYAVGKVAAELMLRRWHDQTHTPLAVLRLPGVYGPGDRGRSVVGKLVESARSGQPFSLAGEGSWRRDYVWVDDIARVVTALMETDFTELTLNVATGRSLSIRDVIDRVAALYGPVPLNAVAERGADGHLEFDISRRRSLLPGVDLTGLEEGLDSYGDLHDA
ncbi:MAG: NAD(P)-dependent oxidoreductase [Verrucomicrobia bacterium]|jgi:UDP-glucose 4-epimerase|nr:NAD(P)-dependent oxidoreductase [Verrucomicrobiota bacterium]MBT7067673.1 NAD(P)-dependent oxidoreductase [Verrucomicrobiota bacterium]MBT7700130.1 NAD(P)-dependent oxidoreductase [Verrucomicrobiota bacterium]